MNRRTKRTAEDGKVKSISVLLPVDLLSQLDTRAKRERRSRSAEAIVLIEKGIRSDDSDRQAAAS